MIDEEKLRQDLMDYYGAAMSVYPIAITELTRVEYASLEELISIAQELHFDLSKYEVKNYRH